jgi:hypothetical protein
MMESPPAPPPPPHSPAPEYAETQTYESATPPLPEFSPLTTDEPHRDGQRPSDREDAPPRPAYRPRPDHPEATGTPAFAWILLAYSVVITVVAGYLAYQYFTTDQKGDHPFQAIPDFYGKYEKATGADNRKQLSFQGLPDPKLDVPPELRVKLGDDITVGAIQVRPTAVTQQVMQITRANAVQQNVISDAGNGLILTLHVKNVSADTSLHPDDPAFNRAYQKDQPAPFTALQYGREFFYGPFAWPLEPDIKDLYMTGFKPSDEVLSPGQERDVQILSAPSGVRVGGVRAAVDAVKDARDSRASGRNERFLWRVQLRRGFVKAKGVDGGDVDISATTVIGVEFKADDVKER